MLKELQQVEQDIQNLADELDEKLASAPPMYEIFITVFSLAFAVFLLVVPEALTHGDAASQWKPYLAMLNIMPQVGWALVFSAASLAKAIGLLLDNKSLRIIGLLLSAVLYLILTGCFAYGFPNIGVVTYATMGIFTLASLPLVKVTGLRGVKRI